MSSVTERIEFGPPRDKGSGPAFALALLAHALLILALTWGVNWKRSDRSVTYDAEIWSALPQQVAPRLSEPSPVVPPAPPPPTPAPRAPEIRSPPAVPQVDIALEDEKKRKRLAQQKEDEAKRAQALAEREHEQERERQARDDQARQLALSEAKKSAAQKLARQQDKDKLAQAEVVKQRQEALNRMMGLAGSNGSAKDSGSALKSSGPSASYGGRLRAAIRPNVVYTEEIIGNPVATVEVRVTLDGTVISQRLVQSSGNKNWDDAAVNAIIRTRVMPRDIDGRIPDTILIIEMRARG